MLEIQSLKNQLILLRLKFDQAIAEGECFEEVKKIYAQIKDTESAIDTREAQLAFRNKRELQ